MPPQLQLLDPPLLLKTHLFAEDYDDWINCCFYSFLQMYLLTYLLLLASDVITE